MKIFVAFGYNERDRWIKDLVVPFVEACGFEAEHGEVAYGAPLDAAIQEKIRNCDGLLGFLTMRGDAVPDAQASTHRWVVEELAYARCGKKFLVEFREQGIDKQLGAGASYLSVPFDATRKEWLMLRVAEALDQLRKSRALLQLLPENLMREITPVLRQDAALVNVECRFLSNVHHESDWIRVGIIPQPGSIHAHVSNMPPYTSHVKVRVIANGKRHESEYHALNSVAINLT